MLHIARHACVSSCVVLTLTFCSPASKDLGGSYFAEYVRPTSSTIVSEWNQGRVQEPSTLDWVAVKELILSYYIRDTLFIYYICPLW